MKFIDNMLEVSLKQVIYKKIDIPSIIKNVVQVRPLFPNGKKSYYFPNYLDSCFCWDWMRSTWIGKHEKVGWSRYSLVEMLDQY